MPVILLTSDQIGEFDSEGNFAKRPTKDSLGNEIIDLHGTIKRLRLGGKACFITIAPGKDSEANEYKLADEPKPDNPIVPKLKG